MPLFIGLIMEFVFAFATWLATYFTQKVAVTTALVAIVLAMMVALFTAFHTVLFLCAGVVNSYSPMFGAGVQMIISPRISSLLSSYLGFWIVVELYKWKLNLVQLWARTI